MGCVFILGNLASSKFIVGCLMVHGAVLESMVWCTILVKLEWFQTFLTNEFYSDNNHLPVHS